MSRSDLTHHLGRRVEVAVDRPLGSRHPHYPEMIYPLNYGEVPGTVSGDGRPIDAHALGPEEPLGRATGVVVAVIVREDDAEDELGVSTGEARVTEAAIRAAVAFQEHWFRSRGVTPEPDR